MSTDKKRSGEDLEDTRDLKKQKLFSSEAENKISQQKKLQNDFFQKALAEVSGPKKKLPIGSKISATTNIQKTSDRSVSERTSRDDKKDYDGYRKDNIKDKYDQDRREDRRRDEDRKTRDSDRDRSRHRDNDDRRDYRKDDRDRRDNRPDRSRDSDRSKDDRYKEESKKSRSPDPADSRRDELNRLQLAQLEKAQQRLDKLEKGSARDDEKHWKDKSLKDMTTRDWRIFREDHNIATKGGSIPNPIRNWEESGMPSWLLNGIADLNFKSPSPIQMQAIPAGLQKRDVMGTAETGSGKTAAFALPILVHLSKLPQTTGDDGPYAVIMAPTRELAVQIEDKIVDFAKYSPITIRTACLIGGDPIDTQAFHLSKGVEIVVGTPGRINECIEKQMLILTSCHFVVLDEADVMIDMNFEPQILSVLDAIPANSSRKKREDGTPVEPEIHSDYELITVMFSATMPPSIERLARSYLRKPAYVHIGEIGVAVDRIKQNVVFCKNETDKRRKLEELISATAPPVIVFVNQKSTCESIMKFLTQAGHKATSLHSNKNLDSRLYSLDSFKEGQFQVLVATDVARRGLDVPNVQHVINYEMPQKITDYTHRIGRTGRAGQTGLATSLVTNADSHILYDLKQMLQKSPNNTVPQELRDHPAAQFKADGGAKMKDIV